MARVGTTLRPMSDDPFCKMANEAISSRKTDIVTPLESHKPGGIGEAGSNPGNPYSVNTGNSTGSSPQSSDPDNDND